MTNEKVTPDYMNYLYGAVAGEFLKESGKTEDPRITSSLEKLAKDLDLSKGGQIAFDVASKKGVEDLVKGYTNAYHQGRNERKVAEILKNEYREFMADAIKSTFNKKLDSENFDKVIDDYLNDQGIKGMTYGELQDKFSEYEGIIKKKSNSTEEEKMKAYQELQKIESVINMVEIAQGRMLNEVKNPMDEDNMDKSMVAPLRDYLNN